MCFILFNLQNRDTKKYSADGVSFRVLKKPEVYTTLHYVRIEYKNWVGFTESKH
jgi:hypothetical protein